MRIVWGFLAIFAILAPVRAEEVHTRGVVMAAVRLDVYSDYECPGCKALYEKVLTPLIDSYVDKGKVYLVHHEFPLVNHHAHAMEAACYAVAAAKVGKYEQVSDVLFKQQSVWSASGKVDETACSVLTPAEAKKVRAVAKDPGTRAEVQGDIDAALKANIKGTPTVILTHKGKQYSVPGNTSYDLVRRLIDQLMAN